MKKVHFVFAGGGARGAFQLGVVKGLFAGSIKPAFIAANSAGSLNAFTISRCGIGYAEKVWRSIKSEKDIFVGNAWVTLPWKTGKMSPKPLRKKLEAAMKAGPAFEIPFCVTTVSLLSGEIRYTTSQDDDILNMAVASASIPGYVECYQPETFAWSDGGTKENLPLAAAQLGADLVICIHCSPEDPRRGDTWKIGNALQNGLRAIEMATEENYKADRFGVCGAQKVPVLDIFPEVAILGPLDFNPAKIAPAIDYGYKRGIAALSKIRELLGE